MKFFKTFLLLIFCSPLLIKAQKDSTFICVGFYNLENLFDTIIDKDATKILQKEFTPLGVKKWNTQKYLKKLNNLANVIADIGTDYTSDGAAILGVAEVENKEVLKDLIGESVLKKRKYKIVHFDSPDKRGIDVGLLYNPSYFEVISTRKFSLKINNFSTRDQLLVIGNLKGQRMHIIIAHWPSRRGGKTKSQFKRIMAADLTRSIVDSIQKKEADAQILFMGDLNDNPNDSSIVYHLKTEENKTQLKQNLLFNPMQQLYNLKKGTSVYRGKWDLFDQILITPSIKNYYQVDIFSEPYMWLGSNKIINYPFRTYLGNKYIGGYSDHFPVYLLLLKDN